MVAVEDVYEQMCAIAKEEGAECLVLFGSRARGTNFPKSDFDIAVAGCPSFNRLVDRFENELWTLLDVDVVNLDAYISPELRAEIERDGMVLYEKVR